MLLAASIVCMMTLRAQRTATLISKLVLAATKKEEQEQGEPAEGVVGGAPEDSYIESNNCVRLRVRQRV